jgi:hypothetical protein
MSSENVKKVIARAVSDAGFRELLSRSSDEAFAGYDLTEQEKSSILAGLSHEGFDALASDLGDRVSRAGVHLDDFMGELADMVRAGEADATPIPLPDPPAPEDEVLRDDFGATPQPIPQPEDEVLRDDFGATPLPIPRPEDEVLRDDFGATPLPIPHPEDEAAEVGHMPIPLTEPEHDGRVPLSELHPAEDEPELPGPSSEAPDDGGEATPINIP